MEGAPYDEQFDRWGFRTWLCRRFQMTSEASVHDMSIIESFSTSEVDAFHQYFALLAEFLSAAESKGNAIAKSATDHKMAKQDFAEMMIAIRERPPMYLGNATFLGLSSYLMGDERAQLDLGFAVDEGRAVFRDFQKWVEIEQNNFKLRRPWFKIVEFWSMGDNSAYTLFLKWLDLYSRQIGKPGLFGPIPARTVGIISRQIH
jgi:hypothetical protein